MAPQRQALGLHLRTERLARGLSLADLAQRVKVTKDHLSRLECGKAKPSKTLIERIAAAMNIDACSFHKLSGLPATEAQHVVYSYPVDTPAVFRETSGRYAMDAVLTGPLAQKRPVVVLAPASARVPRDMEAVYELVNGDCLDWLEKRAPNSIHAVVTDPPYGLREYTDEEKTKLRRGRGGVWRIPPSFDGCTRRPVPRFSVLTEEDKANLRGFLACWAAKVFPVVVPGGHVFIATNPLVSHLVYLALEQAGFEKRGEIIRLVQTLRGGDRPKNAHNEFHSVTVMPRSCWEPWGLFRKPCEGRVQDNLRKWKTGGLRRISGSQPFCDVIRSAPTRGVEREIAPHPSLKPQSFMRQIVRAALPLGEGVVLDPFMGGGATIAAACALGYHSIGIELDPEFYQVAVQAIPRLASLAVGNGDGNGMSALPRPKAANQQGDLFR